MYRSHASSTHRFPTARETGPALFRLGLGKHLRKHESNGVHYFSYGSRSGRLAARTASGYGGIYAESARYAYPPSDRARRPWSAAGLCPEFHSRNADTDAFFDTRRAIVSR